MLSRLRAIKSGDFSELPGAGAQSTELVMCVGFSRDGQFLYCGTNRGLRVYAWDSFPRGPDSVTPAPVWQYSPRAESGQEFHQQVNAIVEDVDGSGLVFGGWSGKIARLDLRTGEVQPLVSLPGDGGIHSLAISRGGEALAVSSSFSRRLNQGTVLPDMNTLEVFAHTRLRESATKLA
jgi:WD40 repeat protein